MNIWRVKDISDELRTVDIIILVGMHIKEVGDGVPTTYDAERHLIWHFGNSKQASRACGMAIMLRRPKLFKRQVRRILLPPPQTHLSGRAAALRVVSKQIDLCIIAAHAPPKGTKNIGKTSEDGRTRHFGHCWQGRHPSWERT